MPPSAAHSWAARPGLSRGLRFAIFLFPLGCAFAATLVARALLPDSIETTLASWFGLLALGVVVAIGAERIARRFLPLATLLKLSMLFPARAPSRFKVARRAGSIRQLEDLSGPNADGDAGRAAEAILTLVAALGAHDRRTRGHAERVRVYTDMIADELELPEFDRHRLRWSALLHDIGKLSIDASILNKSEPLTAEEWSALRLHPAEGLRTIGPLVGWLGPWAKTILHHHERFDGTGYPSGLAAEQINVGARIVAVADTYDTMTSARSYKRPMGARAAREELVWCAGSQLDPEVVRAFLAISLPRLVWAAGPSSLLAHLPFLMRLRAVGQVGIASAARAATASAVAGVVAVGLVAPASLPAERTRPEVVRADDRETIPDRGNVRDERDKNDERDKDDERDGNGGGRNEDEGDVTPPPDEIPPPDDVPVDPGDEAVGPTPEPTPEPEPEPPPPPEEPKGVAVPDVIGMRDADATAVLEGAGFVVRVVKAWGDDKDLKNRVSEQSEAAGSFVPRGTTITITVLKWRNSG
jgi:HD-GYP domain-containing protein (c-di-GMP phosphodiesterase class II)/outer membrane biosynthesis protein TonB